MVFPGAKRGAVLRRVRTPADIHHESWRRPLSDAVRSLTHGGNFLLLLNVGVFVVVGAAALLGPVRLEYKIYAIAAMCLFLTKHTEPLLQSTTRYSLAVFAAYPALSAKFGRGLPFASVLLIAAALNLLLFRTFLDWGLVI